VSSTAAAVLASLACALSLNVSTPAQLFPGSVIPTPAIAGGPIVGDLNGDGHEDLVLRLTFNNALRVFLSDGAGGVVQLPDVPAPVAIPLAVGDLTGDGFADVVTSSSGFSAPPAVLNVFAGNGTGALAPPVSHPTGSWLTPATLVDVNEDGRLDVLAISASPAVGIKVLLGDGAGGLSVPIHSPTAQKGSLLEVGDLDEDGQLDVVLASTGSCCPDVELLLGDGTGSFVSNGLHSQGIENLWSLTLGDVNGDRHLDVVSTADGLELFDPDLVAILLGDGAGGLAPPVHVQIPNQNSAFDDARLFDLEPDGDLDLLVRLYPADEIAALANDGSGGFAEPQYLLPAGTLVLGSFDGDSHSDAWVVFDESSSGGMSIFAGHPGGGFDTVPHYPAGGSSADLDVVDLDGDGVLDVLRGTSDADGFVAVQLGDGAGGLLPASLVSVPGTPEFVAAGDLDEDGVLDLVTSNTDSKVVSVLPGDGSGGFGPPINTLIGSTLNELGVADFNGDGHLDVLVASSASVVLLKGNGTGALTIAGVGPGSAGGLTRIDLADIDHDGDPDAVGASDAGVTVWRGNGGLGFQSITLYPFGGTPQDADFADLNLDGHQDIAATSEDGTFAVLLGNGVGGFGTPSIQSAGSGLPSRSLDVADVSGDGWPDLIVSRDSQNRVFVLLGDGSGTFLPESAGYVMGLSPQPITVVDFDGDARPDVLGGGGWTYTSLLRGAAEPFTWKQLGAGLAGALEAPTLTGHGTLATGSTVSLSLVNARPLATAYLIASHTKLSAPFKGGVLVPFPSIVVAIGTNAAGGFLLSATVGPGIPSGFTHYFQVWVADPGGPAGFTASNALSGTTP